jgi:D-alanine--poly(phosphoribitol) ligase subunit 2
MTKKDRILQCVFSALDELNEGLPREKRLAKAPEVVLFGEQGHLDSLGLATLVVLSEQKVEEEFGHPVTVADERAMSQHRSPFRTIGTMADYITLLVEEE